MANSAFWLSDFFPELKLPFWLIQPEMNQQFNVPKGASLLLEFNLVISQHRKSTPVYCWDGFLPIRVETCQLCNLSNLGSNKISFLLFSKTFSTTDNMILWLLHIVSSSISLLDFKSSFLLLFILYIQEGFQFNIKIIITNPISYKKQYFVLL